MALQRNQIQLSSKNALSLAHCTVGCFLPKLFLHTTPHYCSFPEKIRLAKVSLSWGRTEPKVVAGVKTPLRQLDLLYAERLLLDFCLVAPPSYLFHLFPNIKPFWVLAYTVAFAITCIIQGELLVQWLTLLPQSKKPLVWHHWLTGGLSVWHLHRLPLLARVLSEHYGFLPPPKHVWLTGDSKLSIGAIVSLNGNLPLCNRLVTCLGWTAGIGSNYDPELCKCKKMDI